MGSWLARGVDAVSLYLRLLALSLRGQMQYRASFLLMTLGQFAITGIEVLGVWALFARFGTLTGWSLPQVAFFYGIVNSGFALTDAFARGFDQFGTRFIKTGNFDRVLLRPRTTVLQIASEELSVARVGRLAQGLIVLGWAATRLEVDWSFGRLLLLGFTVLTTMIFFYATFIYSAVVSFWSTETLELMNVVTHGGVETAQYPMAIYERWFRRFFTLVVPLACVVYFPGVAILGVQDPLGTPLHFQLLAPLAGWLFFGSALLVWRIGVRHYTSTGS